MYTSVPLKGKLYLLQNRILIGMALHGSADVRRAKVLKKKSAEGREVFFAIEMLKHVLAGGPAKWAERGWGVVDHLYSRDKVFQRARAIEKTILAV